MTTKEKANELVEKFKKYAHSNPTHDDELFYRRLNENAKQCALIAVDEMLNDCDASSPFEEKRLRYWQEVKLEIEKL